jgi:hypothetical protein
MLRRKWGGMTSALVEVKRNIKNAMESLYEKKV